MSERGIFETTSLFPPKYFSIHSPRSSDSTRNTQYEKSGNYFPETILDQFRFGQGQCILKDRQPFIDFGTADRQRWDKANAACATADQ